MLPTFVVIGAMKAGTTSLYGVLGKHPDVFMCTPKEPQFFTTRWDKGLDWYEGLFAAAGDATARGDASTSYTDYPRKPEAAGRMASVLPGARLVYVVRDPVDRMRSHYRHRVSEGIEDRPIEVALADPRYLDRSRYALQLEQYLERYDRSRLLVVSAEEIFASPEEALPRVFEFIGVDPALVTAAPNHSNVSAKRMQLSPRGRRLRRRWGGSAAYQALPTPLRRAAKSWNGRTATANDDGRISPELRAQIMNQLSDDMSQVYALTGIDFRQAEPAAS